MGRLLCHCLVVEEAEVRRVIRQGARTVEDIAARCDAGTGCGSCRAGIAIVLDEELRRRAQRGDADDVLAQLGLFGTKPRP
jgi:bacterioferritin-associated ferredoxin